MRYEGKPLLFSACFLWVGLIWAPQVSNSIGFRILVGNSKGNMQRTGEASATVRGGPVVSTTVAATTVAPTTTVAAATVASTTTPPGATSTTAAQPTSTRTTAVAAGTSTSATVTSVATPPTVPPSCTPIALADPPTKGGIPCLQVVHLQWWVAPALLTLSQCCFGASATMSQFGATLNVEYDSFDCPTWLAALSTQLGGGVRVCAQRRGSFIATLESDTAVGQRFDAWAAGLAQNQQLGNQPATSAVKTDGTVVAAPGNGGSNVGFIVGVVVGALVLVAIIIIVVIVVALRRRKQNASGYSSLRDDSLSSSSYVALQPSYAPVAASTAAAASTVVRVRVNAKIDAVDSSTLSVAAGTVATIEMADWTNRGDWVWATVGASQGYVPSSFCEPL